MWTAWRDTDISGVSSVTWLLAGAHSAAVIVAGWPLIASVFYGTFGVATAGIVVGLVVWRTQRASGDVELRTTNS